MFGFFLGVEHIHDRFDMAICHFIGVGGFFEKRFACGINELYGGVVFIFCEHQNRYRNGCLLYTSPSPRD